MEIRLPFVELFNWPTVPKALLQGQVLLPLRNIALSRHQEELLNYAWAFEKGIRTSRKAFEQFSLSPDFLRC